MYILEHIEPFVPYNTHCTLTGDETDALFVELLCVDVDCQCAIHVVSYRKGHIHVRTYTARTHNTMLKCGAETKFIY